MEFLEFCAAMWPDNECIVHISDPHLRLKYGGIQDPFLKERLRLVKVGTPLPCPPTAQRTIR